MTLLETYHYLNTEAADIRTNNWVLMSNPLHALCLIAFYIGMVFYAIPKFMQNRKAYELKEFIIVYNIFQVVACTYITYGMLKSGWTTHYDLFCQSVDSSEGPEAMSMANLFWWELLLKGSEFIETMVYALRKKSSQISFLHVYHHVSSFLFMWMGTKYHPGGSFSFPPMLNNSVHVIMYTYYLLTLYKASWLQKPLTKFKPYVTIIQMVQFAILIIYGAQSLRFSCKVNKNILYIFIPNVFFVFYLFYGFYKKAFLEKNKKP